MRGLTAFWTWWCNELAALTPDVVKVAYFGGKFARLAKFGSGVSEIKAQGGVLWIPDALLLPGPPVIPKLKRSRSVDVFLPDNLVLKRLIKAPRKARGKLTPLAKLDLKRNTPIPETAAVWRLGPEKVVDDSVTATQYVAKTSDLSALRQTLKGVGLNVRSFVVSIPDGKQLLLDDPASGGSGGRGWRRLNGALLAGSLGVAAFLWLQPALVAQAQLSEIESDLEVLRSETVALRRALDVQASQKSAAARIQAVLRQRPKLVETIRNVTVALPDEAWLLAMSFRPGTITLSGETAGAASELVLGLAQNRQFGDPRLSGPVTRSSSNREKFEIATEPRSAP